MERVEVEPLPLDDECRAEPVRGLLLVDRLLGRARRRRRARPAAVRPSARAASRARARRDRRPRVDDARISQRLEQLRRARDGVVAARDDPAERLREGKGRHVGRSASSAISRTTVSIVPSTGGLTASYANVVPVRRASARLLPSTVPSTRASAVAIPRTIVLRITPELPFASIVAARWTSAASSAVVAEVERSSASTIPRIAQREVRAGVAVGHRVDVERIDPPAVPLEVRERSPREPRAVRARSVTGASLRRGGAGAVRDPGELAEPLDGLDDLAGLQAAGAHVVAGRLAVENEPHALEVRLEAPLRGDHRVRAGVPRPGALPADDTDPGHAAGDGSSLGLLYLDAAARRFAKRSAISSAVRTASAPFSRRGDAWSGRSSVRTPNATGTPVSIAASCSPDAASLAT